ncbi:hypothetical protein O181_001186 [Austropuccinia psidii MF-1]|uniref:Uncharacterized protein n=1 Tax=Austropuccinia psidii MF-1 TaxID=1389203 RepID=A0A9Q3GC67_9BASI|nr:hypothetical protein [Austropuccinia psidii MF-1]
MESTIIQNSNQKDEGLEQQKGGRKQERSPRSFNQKASSQQTSPRREKELKETILPQLQDPKSPKRFHGQFLKNGQSLDRIQGQRGSKNEITIFSK